MFENFRILEGMRVLVVGGGGMGNGRAITTGVGAAGASVAVVDLDGDRASEAAEDVRSGGGTAMALTGDVRSSEDIDRFVSQTVERLGGIDALVTVVGGYTLFTPWIHLDETSDDAWDLIIDVNLRYVFRCIRRVVGVFKQQTSGGSIVSVGSISGSVSSPNFRGLRCGQSWVGKSCEDRLRGVCPSGDPNERRLVRGDRDRGAGGGLSRRIVARRAHSHGTPG